MPYFPLIIQPDDRRNRQGCAPIKLVNCMVKRHPAGSAEAQRAPYFLAPTPGRTVRATMPETVRGLFSAPGCQNGDLFIAHGSSLSRMSSGYAYATVGAIVGGEAVTMRADRSDLALRALGALYRWNGSALSQVTDVDAPTYAQTLAIVARRWVAAFQDNDAFGWSKAGLYNDWDASGVAVDQDLPDPIVGQEEIGGDLWSFNSGSTQIWQPTGGAEDVAFARVGGGSIPFGLAARAAVAKFGGGAMLLAHTRQVMGTSGYDLTPVENLALEDALRPLTATQISEAIAWSYRDGAREFWGLNAGLASGYVFDSETGLWHERTKYGASAYDIDFTASAFGKVFAASQDTETIWTFDDDVYMDGSDAIIREMTVHVPSTGDAPVSRVVFDVKTRAVPVTGQGSSPVMLVRASKDNGQSWGDERQISLPTPATPNRRVQDFAWGLASHEHGLLLSIRISDPIGFAFGGVWINPSDNELNA